MKLLRFHSLYRERSCSSRASALLNSEQSASLALVGLGGMVATFFAALVLNHPTAASAIFASFTAITVIGSLRCAQMANAVVTHDQRARVRTCPECHRVETVKPRAPEMAAAQ